MAWLKNQQPAAQRVRSLFEQAERSEHRLWMNIVNLGEVFYLTAKSKDLAWGEKVLTNLRARVGVVAASNELVMEAAHLKAKYPLSYADAFAAATALRRQAPLVTGDPELRTLAQEEEALTLDWIGPT